MRREERAFSRVGRSSEVLLAYEVFLFICLGGREDWGMEEGGNLMKIDQD